MASGAALTVLTGMACPSTGAGVLAADQLTGTDNLPPTAAALPNAAAGCAAVAPPPSKPPSPPRPGSALTAGAAPLRRPVVLAIWTPKLPIPTEKYGRPSVLYHSAENGL